jgi:DNA polymerase-3 subunit chi
VSTASVNSEPSQVDFYLLGEASPGAARLACRLALMALERDQKIFIITSTESSGQQLDELMWQYPEGRFIPHATVKAEGSEKSPIKIGTLADLNPADVVINLCLEAVPEPERFSRILEIVPYADDEKEASRVKYRIYRNLGLNPRTHEINK